MLIIGARARCMNHNSRRRYQVPIREPVAVFCYCKARGRARLSIERSCGAITLVEIAAWQGPPAGSLCPSRSAATVFRASESSVIIPPATTHPESPRSVSRLSLTASPSLYPIAIERSAQAVQFIQMTEQSYADASFLDSRMLGPDPILEVRHWEEIRDETASLVARCHFIFHISHAGSTLLSRLLGCHPQLFSLREPLILRNLADVYLWLDEPACDWTEDKFVDRLEVFLKLWSRTYRPDQTSVIKATSFASDMGHHLLESVSTARGMLMYVRPQVFLPALLGGTRKDITSLAANRWKRLQRYLGEEAPTQGLSGLTAGECVAMSWLTEMLALERAAKFAERTLWIDFDQFLQAPQRALATCFHHLEIGVSPDFVESLCGSPLMTRYSKAPQHAYDTNFRASLLAESAGKHPAEIRQGMRWLATLASQSTLVAAVLHRAGTSY